MAVPRYSAHYPQQPVNSENRADLQDESSSERSALFYAYIDGSHVRTINSTKDSMRILICVITADTPLDIHGKPPMSPHRSPDNIL